jgi:DNA-binding MarR family transcriptional regulator
MYMPTNPSKRAKNTDDEDALAMPLPHLSDQVAVSVARHKELDGSALWVLLAVYRGFATLDRDQSDEVAAIGLTPLQFNILTTLQRAHQPTTMGALAAMMVVKPNNLSGNISFLVDQGLVKRELNVSDQRSLLAVLTPVGEAFLAKHLPPHWRRLERLMGGMSRAEKLQLVGLLNQMTLSIQTERGVDPEPRIEKSPAPRLKASQRPPLDAI